jgi:hypothetical protein
MPLHRWFHLFGMLSFVLGEHTTVLPILACAARGKTMSAAQAPTMIATSITT